MILYVIRHISTFYVMNYQSMFLWRNQGSIKFSSNVIIRSNKFHLSI